MSRFERAKEDLLRSIYHHGDTVEDKRLNRTVVQVFGICVVITSRVLLELQEEPLPEKFTADQERMQRTFDLAVLKAKADPDSRQLLVLNTDNFEEVQQCFQLLQFHRHDDHFHALGYQRSGDMSKLKEDWIFFSHMAKKFEQEVGQEIDQIAITYGNLHVEVRPENP